MASLGMGFGVGAAAASSRGFATKAAAAKSAVGATADERGLLDWIMGGLQKDQLLETDPILEKVEEKSTGTRKSTTSVSIPNNKKFPGFSGLFTKN